MSVLANLIVKLSADTSALERGLKGAQGHTSKFDRVMKTAMIGGATAIAGLGMASLKMGMDFEKSMAEVKTLIPDISEKSFGKMRDDVLDLSKEMGIATDKAVPALYQAISASIPRENVMEFMAVASKAAIGGCTDLETAVDGLTTVVNAFGYEASEAGRVADVMFTGVKLGKTTMNELSTSMFQAAPLAAALGLEIEHVVAATATLTKSGTPTSVAMSQIRQAMVSLSKPNADMISLLEKTSFASGDALLQSEGFAGALDILTKAAGGNKEMMAKAFGSVEALQAVLGLTGENAEIAAADLAAMTNAAGAADAAFETISKTTSYKLNKAINEMKVEMTRVAVKVLPLLVGGLEKIAPIIIPLVGAIAALIAAWAAWKIVGLVSQIGTLVTALRSMNLALLGPVGIVAALGIGTIALGKFIDKNRDAIDKMPILGGLVKGSARYQRELNDALAETNDLLERNLLTMEEAAQRTIQDYADAIATLKVEYEGSAEAILKWQKLGLEAHEVVASGAAELVKDMQREGATYREVMKALERAGIDLKDTTINDVLKPMREQYFENIGAIEDQLGGWEIAHRAAAEAIPESTRFMWQDTRPSLESIQGAYEILKGAIESVLPTMDEEFAEWRARIDKMAQDYAAWETNLTTIYKAVTASGVENIDALMLHVAEQGPTYAAHFGKYFAEDPEAALETLRIAAPFIMGETGAGMLREIGVMGPKIVLAFEGIGYDAMTGFYRGASGELWRLETLQQEIDRVFHASPEYFTWNIGWLMGEDLAQGLMHGFKVETPALAAYLRQWGYTVAEDLSVVPLSFYETAGASVKSFKEALQDNEKGIRDTLREFGYVVAEDLTVVPLSFYDSGMEAMKSFKQALIDDEQGMRDALRKLGFTLAEDMTIVPLSFYGIGEDTASSLVGGLTDEAGRLKASVGGDVANSLRLAMASLSPEALSWGEGIAGYIMQGIWQGFTNAWDDWAEMISDTIYQGLQDALDAASPAKKMIPLGVMAAQGYGQGFQQALGSRSVLAPALAAPVPAAGISGGGTTVNHYDIHFDGPVLGDHRQAEEFANFLESTMRRRLG